MAASFSTDVNNWLAERINTVIFQTFFLEEQLRRLIASDKIQARIDTANKVSQPSGEF